MGCKGKRALSKPSNDSAGTSALSVSDESAKPQPESSQRMSRLVISRERTAFWNAASNERSIAMTSPVAFICVLMERSPAGNLSKGQRGILTTQ